MKKKRERIPDSTRASKEKRARIQKITMTMSRERPFHCLLREFDVAGFHEMLRQKGMKEQRMIDLLTTEQWRHRQAMKYAIWKTAKTMPNDKGEKFLQIMLQATCKCYKSDGYIESAKEFLNHLEGRDAMGIPDYSEKYKAFLKEVRPSWVFDDSPHGPKNTLSEDSLKKVLKKIEVLTSPPEPKSEPTDPDIELLKKLAPTDVAYKIELEKRLKGVKKDQKENPKKLSQTETIADALETTRGAVRKDKKRLKEWNML